MSLIYHLHYYGDYQCTLQVQNTFCYFRWNINIILIWLYNSHLFKCAMRYRSDSQWAGGICFRASCRASKRSSGSVSSDTNKQPGQKLSSVSTHLQCDRQTDLQAARLLDIIWAALFSVYYIWGLWFSFNPIPKFGTILKFKTLMWLCSKNKH